MQINLLIAILFDSIHHRAMTDRWIIWVDYVMEAHHSKKNNERVTFCGFSCCFFFFVFFKIHSNLNKHMPSMQIGWEYLFVCMFIFHSLLSFIWLIKVESIVMLNENYILTHFAMDHCTDYARWKDNQTVNYSKQ